MNNSELIKHIRFKLSSVAKTRVGAEWNYQNVISSFTRLYLITGGDAFIYIGDKQIRLRPGYLYLVPSFAHCSYMCEKEMSHYYATFTIQLADNLSIYQLYNFRYELKAKAEHYDYFKKLHEINPNMALPANDPVVYQRMRSEYWNHGIRDVQRSLKSTGLLNLLLSDFIGDRKIDFEKGDANNILSIVKYIHMHLDEDLSIATLADKACLSTGHFTRRFKALTKLSPIEYINKQRIEKAQLLLNTTSESSIAIADKCGYKSDAYFCKIFKKYIGQAPGEYRVNQV